MNHTGGESPAVKEKAFTPYFARKFDNTYLQLAATIRGNAFVNYCSKEETNTQKSSTKSAHFPIENLAFPRTAVDCSNTFPKSSWPESGTKVILGEDSAISGYKE